jgi:hypothetical protein
MEKLVTLNDTARVRTLEKLDFNKRFNLFAIKILRADGRSQTVKSLSSSLSYRPVARNEKLIEITRSCHIDDTFITAFMTQIDVIRYRLSHNL